MATNTLRPEDVFTPYAPVAGKAVYANREEEEQRTTDALYEKGAQLFLYGDSGVGKTSLIEYILGKEKLGKGKLNYKRIQCDAATEYPALFGKILDHLGVTKQIGEKYREIINGEIRGGLPIIGGKVSAGDEALKEYSRWILEANIDMVVEAIGQHNYIIVLDDFEKVQDSLTSSP